LEGHDSRTAERDPPGTGDTAQGGSGNYYTVVVVVGSGIIIITKQKLEAQINHKKRHKCIATS